MDEDSIWKLEPVVNSEKTNWECPSRYKQLVAYQYPLSRSPSTLLNSEFLLQRQKVYLGNEHNKLGDSYPDRIQNQKVGSMVLAHTG